MIKVHDIAYVRFGAPDLDAMEKFLTDFGLKVSARDDERLYARGTDSSPYVHVTERGDPAFLGIAFEAACAEDLEAVAGTPGASAAEQDGFLQAHPDLYHRPGDTVVLDIRDGALTLGSLDTPGLGSAAMPDFLSLTARHLTA